MNFTITITETEIRIAIGVISFIAGCIVWNFWLAFRKDTFGG